MNREELIEFFGADLYRNNAATNTVVECLVRGQNPLYLLKQILESNNELVNQSIKLANAQPLKVIIPMKETKENFTKEEIIMIVDRLLQYPDEVIDSVSNENTKYSAEDLLKLSNKKIFGPKLVVGNWYWVTFPKPTQRFLINLQEDDNQYFGVGFTAYSNWSDNIRFQDIHSLDLSPASRKEVEMALLLEADKRGFVKGAKFFGIQGVAKDRITEIGNPNTIESNEHGLYCGNSFIFFKGKWTTPFTKSSDKEFLKWIYNRLLNIHIENEHVDYMLRFKEIIDKMN